MAGTAKTSSLDYAERWMRNGLESCALPGFSMSVEADMSGCRKMLEVFRSRGIRVTYTHLFVHAAGQALARHPDLHQVMSSSRRLRPGQVNIALSVAGHSFVAPVLLIKDAAGKTPADIAAEVASGAPRVRQEQIRDFGRLRRWGWLVPFSALRRAILRFLLPRTLWSREDAPALQVTGLTDIDQVSPLLLLTTCVLAVGQVRERAVVLDGAIVARPTVTLTCSVDHRVWDGRMAARFLKEVKTVLESAGPQEPPSAAQTRRGLRAPAMAGAR